MKTIKISDELHAELTTIVGQLIAKSNQMKTYLKMKQCAISKSSRG